MSSLIGYNPATISDAFNAGDYRHVALSISGTIHTLYLDGSAVAVNPTAGNIFSVYNSAIEGLYIGCAGDLSYGYTGIIDDFKIWNRALPASDISYIYKLNYQQPKPIVATVTGTGASIVPIPSLSKSYVAFTSTTGTNTISFNKNVNAKVFMIGGGGGGAQVHGGGGGAGAYYNSTFYFIANTTYTITVGAGGIGGYVVSTYSQVSSQNGGDTTITTGGVTQLIVKGGGRGVETAINGGDGGCGGGAGGVNTTGYIGGSAVAVNTGTNGTGFAGGNKASGTYAYSGGGGGGAGGAGQNAGERTELNNPLTSIPDNDLNGLNGGNGGNAIVVDLTGTAKAYGGGGGGGSWDNNGGTPTYGGRVSVNGIMTYVGGYANTAEYDNQRRHTRYITGTEPFANTGSGGGGGGAFSCPGADGSAGIVIIQF